MQRSLTASTCISVILRWICARVQHGIDKLRSNRFTRVSMLNALHERTTSHRQINFIAIIVVIILLDACSSFASTQGLNQIATPDLAPEGDLSISLQAQDQKLGNPYQAQAEMGLTKWSEIAIFKGFKPNELIFGTEIGLLIKEPYLLSMVSRIGHRIVTSIPSRTSRLVTGESTTNSPPVWPMPIFVTKPSSVTLMISMRHGGCRSIFRRGPVIHPQSDLSGVLTKIFR